MTQQEYIEMKRGWILDDLIAVQGNNALNIAAFKGAMLFQYGLSEQSFFDDLPKGKNVGRVVYQSATPEKHPYNQAGTLQEWKDHIAALAVGNSRLVGGLSISFAPPLLNLVHMESGGFGVYGQSSRGKTTMLEVAGSVWGGGGIHGYIKSWRTTDNGLEGVASNHCDALLCLDELGQVSPRTVSNASYMLANGQGKTRSNKSGQAQPAAEWRTIFLSSGEIPLAQKIAQDKRGNKIMAGQKVRFPDFPMDGGANMGLFENCHGLEPSRFADLLKNNVAKYYGTAARAFLEKLVSEKWEDLQDQIKAMQNAFVDTNAGQADGLVQRAAARFGLVAAAGELATQWEITGWQQGTATQAAQRLFFDWLADHGSATIPTEIIDGVKQVQSFLEQHKTSHFLNWESPSTAIQKQLGFYKSNEQGTTFYIFGNAWQSDICKGFDSQAISKVLAEKGVLEKTANGRPSKTTRLPDKTTKRVYILDASKLGDDIFLQDAPNAGGYTGYSGCSPDSKGFERNQSEKSAGYAGYKTNAQKENVTSVTSTLRQVVTPASPNSKACNQRNQCNHQKQGNSANNNQSDQPPKPDQPQEPDENGMIWGEV